MTITIAAAGCVVEDDVGDPSACVVHDTDVGNLSGRITAPATSALFETFFAVSAFGAGTEAVDDVSLSGHVGTVAILGDRLPALAYYYGPWPEIGYDFVQILVIAPDRWYVMWLYCANDQIEWIWLEGTDGTPLAVEAASGTCRRDDDQRIPRRVEFPAINMGYPPLEDGHCFSGANLHYDGDHPGTVSVSGVDMVLLPFEGVDCSDCPGGDGDGWRELHALLYDPERQSLCFGIFYMNEPNRVDLAYLISLPGLGYYPGGGGASFSAAWDVP